MKLFFYDLETTGLKYWKNGIHQISGIIEIDGEVKETLNFKVKPYASALIEAEALKVAGLTEEQVMAYPDMGHVYRELMKILQKYVDRFNKQDKFFLIGYNNASFDDSFFRAWFVQNGDSFFGAYFTSPPLDAMVLAGQFLKEKRFEMENFKLKTVAKFLGIEVDETKLHDASYDIMLTREIYKKVTTNNT